MEPAPLTDMLKPYLLAVGGRQLFIFLDFHIIIIISILPQGILSVKYILLPCQSSLDKITLECVTLLN